jgi:hypothetical protein
LGKIKFGPRKANLRINDLVARVGNHVTPDGNDVAPKYDINIFNAFFLFLYVLIRSIGIVLGYILSGIIALPVFIVVSLVVDAFKFCVQCFRRNPAHNNDANDLELREQTFWQRHGKKIIIAGLLGALLIGTAVSITLHFIGLSPVSFILDHLNWTAGKTLLTYLGAHSLVAAFTNAGFGLIATGLACAFIAGIVKLGFIIVNLCSKLWNYCKRRPQQNEGIVLEPLVEHEADHEHQFEQAPNTLNIKVNFHISFKELTVGKKLGEGGFGVVYKGTYGREDVAIKMLNQNGQKYLKNFTDEVSIAVKLNHPRIVKTYGASLEGQRYAMVMEFMAHGNLYNLLHSSATLRWTLRYRMAIEITAGLIFLHERNVIHGDLKSLNILLDDEDHAKLSDFGISKEKGGDGAGKTLIGPHGGGSTRWMAPEVFKSNSNSIKADVYSYAIVLWELCSRRLPHEKISDYEVPGQVINGLRDPIPEAPPKMAESIRKCWLDRAESRPTLREVMHEIEPEYNQRYKGHP